LTKVPYLAVADVGIRSGGSGGGADGRHGVGGAGRRRVRLGLAALALGVGRRGAATCAAAAAAAAVGAGGGRHGRRRGARRRVAPLRQEAAQARRVAEVDAHRLAVVVGEGLLAESKNQSAIPSTSCVDIVFFRRRFTGTSSNTSTASIPITTPHSSIKSSTELTLINRI